MLDTADGPRRPADWERLASPGCPPDELASAAAAACAAADALVDTSGGEEQWGLLRQYRAGVSVAGNVAAPPAAVRSLVRAAEVLGGADCPFPSLPERTLAAAASNPSCPLDVLERLALNDIAHVRAAVAANTAAPDSCRSAAALTC